MLATYVVQANGLLQGQRAIRVPFCTVLCPFKIKDLSKQYLLSLFALMKETALGKRNGLPLFDHEQWLLNLEPSATACPISSKWLEGMVTARLLAQQALEDPSISCFQDIGKVPL